MPAAVVRRKLPRTCSEDSRGVSVLVTHKTRLAVEKMPVLSSDHERQLELQNSDFLVE